MRSFRLSKSRIAAGLHCGKRLWLSVHRPELEQHDDEALRRCGAGTEVGELARQLYAPGTLIADPGNLSAAVRATAAAAAAPGDLTLFEATFRHRNVLVRSDVLARRDGVWRMVEVKSATRVKEHHLQDVAVQAWATEGAGVPLAAISVAVVDTGFVYPGGGAYAGLLREVPVADQVRPLMAVIPGWVRGFGELLAGPMPAVRVGGHCGRPFPCPFVAFCRVQPGLPAEPDDGPQQAARRPDPALAQVDAVAADYLATLPYPRTYLDFETVQYAVPRWAGTRPYQQLVFQWSVHREEAPGELRHHEFIDLSGEAPMRAAVRALLAAAGAEGPVFVYHDSEKWRLVELAEMYPDLAPGLRSLTGRLVDLLRLTRSHYRHPSLNGTCSLKAILPTIAPELDYSLLGEVSDGAAAQAAYVEATVRTTTPARREELRQRLLAYCERDTLGLVRLAWRLEGRPPLNAAASGTILRAAGNS
jgi:hypothetical protein